VKNLNCEFVIIGGGMVGLTIAYQLIKRNLSNKIIIVEKENQLGLHSSGRNSGVLHAGMYYEPDSLKAKVCVEGSRRLKNWIMEKGLNINKCGKLILPQRRELDSQLDLLFERGKKNGAEVEFFDEKQIKSLVPEANITSGRGLWSPNTAVVNPLSIIKELKKELEENGVKFIFDAKEWSKIINKNEITINENLKVNFQHFVNAAGLYSDKVAHKFNIGLKYKIIPFKGSYWKLKKSSRIKVNVNLYPVPDLNVPFLGVHFTPNAISNEVNIGPTATPAFGRENYKIFENIEFKNLLSDLSFLSMQYINNTNNFRKYVHEQAFLSIPPLFLKASKELLPNLKYDDIKPSNKVGLRAQLFNMEKKNIERDFLCISNKDSTHILNAISPAFTASFAFADLIIDKYISSSIK